jgi:hypothetical protein
MRSVLASKLTVLAIAGILLTGGMALMILSGEETPNSGIERGEKIRTEAGRVGLKFKPNLAPNRLAVLPASYAPLDPTDPSEPDRSVQPPPDSPPVMNLRKEVTRTIPLDQLPVSPEFLRRLENESADSSPSEPVHAAGRAAMENVAKGDPVVELPPGSFRIVAFTPGLTGTGKPIRNSVELAELQPVVGFPPDYSLDTATPQKSRLLSLGNGGILTLEVVGGYLADGEGADLVVFENPFIVKGTNGREVYAETAVVSVSPDNSPDSYREFPCHEEQSPYRGCAGVVPVRYAAGLPLDSVGGDLFDLGVLGVSAIRYIRIRDTGDNRSYLEGTEGFDLDGVALLHTVKEKP